MTAEQIGDRVSPGRWSLRGLTLRHTTLRAYVVAVVLVGVSLLVRWMLRAWFAGNVAYLQFFPAIMVAAWYGGLGPGIVATALSALAATYFFLPPAGPLVLVSTPEVISLAIFIAIGLGISWLNHQLRTAAVLSASRAERLEAIIKTTVDGIIVIDAEGRIEAFNPAAERLFGYPAQEVLGRNVAMLMPSPYREEHDTYLARYLATGRAKIIGSGRQVQGLRKDGTTFPLHLSVGQITLQGERKFTGILHDLSGRVQMEGQLREQAALAKLGEMAALIAHEVKNPLAGIRGAVQVFGSQMSDDGKKVQVLKEIVSRIDALDQMMKDLLLFARPPKPRRAPTDLVPLVTATASLLSEDPALKEVNIEVEGSAPAVSADPDMLRIVFQNLLINGAHAMQGKGRIRVSVGTVDSSCQIAVIDDGPGIPTEIRQKIFTPFFTTKRRGSGLGLPTAKRLIEAHDGQITIDCPTAGGTAVVIRLPIGAA
jgi:two-component system sensor kinase FixL